MKPIAMSPFYLIGLPIPPPPKPRIRTERFDLDTGRLEVREWRTDSKTTPLAWTDDLSTFIDNRLRLWRVPQ
jgi:hypothetical protein